MSAETLVQALNLGVVAIISFVLYRGVREDSPMRARAKWALLFAGVFLVGAGLLAGISERSVTSMLLLKHFGLGAGAICLGYAFMVSWLLCVLLKPRAERVRVGVSFVTRHLLS